MSEKLDKKALRKSQNCYARALRGAIQEATGFQQAGHLALSEHAVANAQAAFKDWVLVTSLLNEKE